MQKIKNLLKAALVISVILALVLPSSAVITNMNTKTDAKIQYKYNIAKETAINKIQPTQGSLIRGEDVLVSWDNPDNDDITPKITQNDTGAIIVTYASRTGAQTQICPIAYSNDGVDWIVQYQMDSAQMDGGSGWYQSPDIAFSSVANNFSWVGIDPAGTYITTLTYVPADIAGSTEIQIYAYTWQDSDDFTEVANTMTGIWTLVLDICTGNGIDHHPGLAYYTYDETIPDYLNPVDYNPDWCAGTYYDGQSVLNTAPASKPEMATGVNRLFMVMETNNDTTGFHGISYKATYNDLNPASATFLFQNGGGPSGMDKYADIEVWPFQMHIAETATDPDVAAEGSMVAVVYTQNGNIKCKASNDDGTTWAESTVAQGGYSCVYIASNHIYVGYVNNGNLYFVNSADLGTTWSTPTQINDQDGTVVEKHGTASLGLYGIVWTDARSDSDDVYFEPLQLQINNPPSKTTITGPSHGKSDTPLSFVFKATDADDDQVKYLIDWGDDKTDTTPLYPQNTDVTVTHSWSTKKDYTITVKAQDSQGLNGLENTFTVKIPRNNAINFNSLLMKVLEHFPVLERILNL